MGSNELDVKPRKSQRKRKKPKKGKKKVEKAKTTTPRKIERLIRLMKRHADHQKPPPADRLFHFFNPSFSLFQLGSACWGILMPSV